MAKGNENMQGEGKKDPRLQPKEGLKGASDIVAAQSGAFAVPVDDTQPR